MMRALVPLLTLALIAACADGRNRPAKQGDDPEAGSVVVIHPGIDDRVRYVKHDVGRTDDGRLSIVVVLGSRSSKDRALVVDTQWFDGRGIPLERSTARQILVPRGGTFVYEDTSYSAKAERFSVSVRQATTKRKK